MDAATRPRMKVAAPLLRGGGELHIVGSLEVTTIADPHGAVHRLVELADGSRTTQELFAVLAIDYPQLSELDVVEVVCELESAGLFEDCSPRPWFLRDRDTDRDRYGSRSAPPTYV